MNDVERPRGQQLGLVQPQVIDINPTVVQGAEIGAKREYAGLLEYWQMVQRHKGAMVLAVVAGGVLGFLVTLSSPRIYQASTTLEYQGLNEDFLNLRNVTPVADSGSSGYIDTDIQTQVRLLQSGALIGRVQEKLAAGKTPENLQPPDRIGLWRKALRINPPTANDLWAQALGTAAGSIRARSSGTNRIIEVSCDSTHPQLAADFCNTLTKEYIDQNLEARWKTTEYTGKWLTNQLDDLKIKLEKQEEETQAYARATGLIITEEKNDARQSQLEDMEKEVSVARGDRITKQSKFEMAMSSPATALPDVLDDATLRDTQHNLAELHSKLAQLLVTFKPEAPEVRKIQAQITSLEASLNASRGNIVTRLRNDFEAAERREKLLNATYQAQVHLVSSKVEELSHYNLLKRDVDSTRTLYESLLQRLKEASIAAALRANNIRVVDAAPVPGGPYKPNVRQAITVGLLFGAILGVAFAVLRERANRTLQDPGDIAFYLGLPELGVVPVGDLLELKSKKAPLSLPAGASAAARTNDERVELVSFKQKTSLLAESFRTTLTSILFSQKNGERPRVLIMTSASPKEGKTTVVSNLAITLSEIQKRVLVIDADMRRPRLHQIFGVENNDGLSNLLLEKERLSAARLDAAVVQSDVPGLFVLASGSSRAHASSLVHSERLAELIALARDRFDTVLIDTPPMVNIADARVLARLGDALILVVRSGATTRDAALLAKTRFAEDGVPIMGSILNFWNPQTPGYGYYKYYYAGYYHYYGAGSGNHPTDGPTDEGGNGSSGDDPRNTSKGKNKGPVAGDAWKPGYSFRRQVVDRVES